MTDGNKICLLKPAFPSATLCHENVKTLNMIMYSLAPKCIFPHDACNTPKELRRIEAEPENYKDLQYEKGTILATLQQQVGQIGNRLLLQWKKGKLGRTRNKSGFCLLDWMERPPDK